MKNELLLSILSLMAFTSMVASCSVADEAVGVSNNPAGGMTEFVAVLDSSATRTTLSSDGFSVTWDSDDKIGVYSVSSGGFSKTKYENEKADLCSGAGQRYAVFSVGTGMKTPRYAYYPYNANAGKDYKSVSMTLPPEQSQSGEVANTSLYDVKVGEMTEDQTDYRSYGYEGRYVFTFHQMLSMLYIEFTPSAAIAGDKLQYIKLEDAGSILAGDYTLNLKSSSITFGSQTSSSLTLTYSDTPVLEEGKKVKGWLFSNAGIREGDNLVFTIRTDSHIVNVNVDSKVTMEKGMRYTLPLDVASLVTKGKAVVRDYDSFYEVSSPGVYNGTDPVFVYEDGASQYAIRGSSQYRIQNISGKKALIINVDGSLEKGSEASLTFVSYGGTGVDNSTVTATVKDNDGNTVWLKDSSGNGYILALDL